MKSTRRALLKFEKVGKGVKAQRFSFFLLREHVWVPSSADGPRDDFENLPLAFGTQLEILLMKRSSSSHVGSSIQGKNVFHG